MRFFLLCLFLSLSLNLFALQADFSWALADTQIQTPYDSAGDLEQLSYFRSQEQIIVSDQRALGNDFSYWGHYWVRLDNLPSNTPVELTQNKVDFTAHLLEGGVSKEWIPAVLIWDIGKKILHPSSGFFKTPLNVMSRTVDTLDLGGQAVSPYEEGWIGTGLTWLTDWFTAKSFFAPAMTWSSETDKTLKYITSDQNSWHSLNQVSFKFEETDIQLLEMTEWKDPGTSMAKSYLTGGLGIDSQVGDALTLRAEATIKNHGYRLIPDNSTYTEEERNGIVDTMAGFTWSLNTKWNLMMEYGFNSLGFSGSSYEKLLDYTKTNRFTTNEDLIDQFGNFNSACHYLFSRIAGDLGQGLSCDGWIQLNAQDASGLFGGSFTFEKDNWSVSAHLQQTFGSSESEGGYSVFLWRALAEVKFSL